MGVLCGHSKGAKKGYQGSGWDSGWPWGPGRWRERNVVRRDSRDEGYGSGAVLHGDKVRFGCRGGWWRESEEDSYSLRKQADVEAQV